MDYRAKIAGLYVLTRQQVQVEVDSEQYAVEAQRGPGDRGPSPGAVPRAGEHQCFNRTPEQPELTGQKLRQN